MRARSRPVTPAEARAYRAGIEAGRKEAEGERQSKPDGDEPKALTMSDIKQMSTDEINARWEEVSAVLEGGDRG